MFGTSILPWIAVFCLADSFLTATNLQGVYYLIHAAHNGFVVYFTYHEVWQTLTDFGSISSALTNYTAAELVFGLHIYHCIYYWRKFRTDDWLHHILMIAVALPIGVSLPAGTLLGFSLFFTTGLPGGIDYFLLFLVRNGVLHKDTEKRINTRLATWVRMPGCIAQAALTAAYLSTQNIENKFLLYLAYLSAALNYWNGAYFGQQVIYDAGVRNLYGPRNLPA
jgi:hypothetical protein